MPAPSNLDFRDRAALINTLEADVFDVLIIGGGITGAGVARDAAMRGLSVALVEAQDFASGTSSRSSKMIHGGLRYLAQGDVALVREAASERKVLHAIAPHLAQPAWFLLPSPSRGSTAKLKAALWTFDRLGGVAAADRHSVLTPDKLAAREPLVRSDSLHRAIMYREYLTDDARLTLANIRSAKAHGAVVANYLGVTVITGGAISEIVCQPTLPEESGETRIRARKVINAAGPWVDALRQTEDGAAEARLALSRGIHLVVARETLAVSHTCIINTPDKRSIFAVPRGAFTYIGTTDTFYPTTDYWPRVEQSDVDYLIGATRAALHADGLSADKVISVWAGIRPLVRQAGKSAADISRKDEMWTGPEGMLSIAGGKLSAYRAMADRIVSEIVAASGKTAKPCGTGDEPLPGGEAPASASAELTAFGADTAERLLRLYGTEAESLVSDGGDIAAEARRAVLVEGALRLEDYWARRSGRAWFDDRSGLASLAPAAAEMARLLGWSDARTADEIQNCRNIDALSKSDILTGEQTT